MCQKPCYSRQIATSEKIDDETTTKLKVIANEKDKALMRLSQYEDQFHALNSAVRLISQFDLRPLSRDDVEEGTQKEANDWLHFSRHLLDDLNSRWKLEETAIPSLLEMINTLQSNYIVSSREADISAIENRHLRQSLSQCQESNKSLQNMTIQFAKQNECLMDENRKLKRQLRKVKKITSDMQVQEKKKHEMMLVTMLKYHEDVISKQNRDQNTPKTEEREDDKSSIPTSPLTVNPQSCQNVDETNNEPKDDKNDTIVTDSSFEDVSSTSMPTTSTIEEKNEEEEGNIDPEPMSGDVSPSKATPSKKNDCQRTQKKKDIENFRMKMREKYGQPGMDCNNNKQKRSSSGEGLNCKPIMSMSSPFALSWLVNS